MPQLRQTALGNSWVSTPFDDAERQNAQGLDAWNMAQHQNDWQNQRHGQSRSDAWAMNRDNLNFGAWREGQTDSRNAASMAAQERLAKMGFDFQTGLQKSGWEREDALDTRRWTRDQPFRDVQTAAATGQKEYYDRQAQQAREADSRNKALQTVLATPEGQAAARSGDRAALMELMRKQNALVPADYYLEQLQKVEARKDAAGDARRDRLVQDYHGDDPAAAVEAERILTTDANLKGTVDLGKRKVIPFQRGNIAHRPVEDAITAELRSGSIRQELNMLPRDDTPIDPATTQRLGAQIRRAAARIGEATGVDPRSIEADILAQIQGMDHTSWQHSLTRGLVGVGTLGLSELDDLRSAREQGVTNALQYLGLAPVTE